MTKRWWLAAILTLAAVLRLWGLNDETRGLHPDEVLYAYDGWSIATTGTDHRQTGYPPLYLTGYSRAWDNRTSIFYPYVVAGMYTFLPITIGVERLPAALAGIAVCWLAYAILKKVRPNDDLAALIAAGWVAVDPAMVGWSRVGHDPMLMVFFLGLMTWLLLGVSKRPWFWLLAGLSLALAMYTYQPAKLIGPLVWLATLVYLWSTARRQWPWILGSLVLAGSLALPLIVVQITHADLINGQLRVIAVWSQLHPWRALWQSISEFFGWGFLLAGNSMFLVIIPAAILGGGILWRSSRRLGIWLSAMIFIGILPALVTIQQVTIEPSIYTRAFLGIWLAILVSAIGLARWLQRWEQHLRPNWFYGAGVILGLGLLFPLMVIQFLLMQYRPSVWSPEGDTIRAIQQARRLYGDQPQAFGLVNAVMPWLVVWEYRISPAEFQRTAVTWSTYDEPRGPGDIFYNFRQLHFCHLHDAACYRQPGLRMVFGPPAALPPGAEIQRYRIRYGPMVQTWAMVDTSRPQ